MKKTTLGTVTVFTMVLVSVVMAACSPALTLDTGTYRASRSITDTNGVSFSATIEIQLGDDKNVIIREYFKNNENGEETDEITTTDDVFGFFFGGTGSYNNTISILELAYAQGMWYDYEKYEGRDCLAIYYKNMAQVTSILKYFFIDANDTFTLYNDDQCVFTKVA